MKLFSGFSHPKDVQEVLDILSEKACLWADPVEGNSDRYDVTFKTVPYNGDLEGFIIRMWPSCCPEGRSITLAVGSSHVRCLTIESWGDLKTPWSESPTERPAEAEVLFEGDEAWMAVEVLDATLQEAYATLRKALFQPKKLGIWSFLDEAGIEHNL